MPFCSMCGAKNEEGYRFCVKCGKAASSPDLKPVDDSGVLDSQQDDNRKKAASVDENAAITETFANKFQVIRKLGKGGMGEVFLVEEEMTGDRMALKVIREEYSGNPEIQARFKREVTLTRKITHTNVIRVFEVGRHDNRLYYTMEYLEGQSLRELISQYKSAGKMMELNRVNVFLKQICTGLAEAHKITVHRDLKPENIMIFGKDEVKILDFGLAKALGFEGETRMGQKMGTPYYMAPEQLRGSEIEIDARADIYSLGIMLYELLTLEIPVPGSEPVSEIRRDVSNRIEEVYRKSIARDRDKRYRDVTSFVNAVIESMTHEHEEEKIRRVEIKSKETPVVNVMRDESEPRVVVPEKPKIEAITSKMGLEMVKIPAGTFLMGSPENEPERQSEEPLHQVTIEKSFWMSKYPITQKIYQAIMGDNPSHFKGGDLPVETVSWYDAVTFCNEISKKEGYDLACSIAEKNKGFFKKEKVIEVMWNNHANGYRLPTEAEWEYACRAGTTSAFYTGHCTAPQGTDPVLDRAGWYNKNSDNRPHPVGEKAPNPWGLYDMHGNVWEWCWDWYGSYPEIDVTDPTGDRSGSLRVLRGGSWNNFAGLCLSAYRISFRPDFRWYDLGFRAVRSIGQ